MSSHYSELASKAIIGTSFLPNGAKLLKSLCVGEVRLCEEAVGLGRGSDQVMRNEKHTITIEQDRETPALQWTKHAPPCVMA